MNRLTMRPTPLRLLQHRVVRTTVTTLLLLVSLAPMGGVHAQATASMQGAALLNDKVAWELDDTAKFLANGTVQLSAADEKPDEPQAVRHIELPPASAWEAELRFSPKPGATEAGLLLVSADDRWITVLLKPAKRGIQVSHGNPLSEDDPVELLGGDNLTAWAANGDQVLKVRGDGGKIQVWLNGQDLGYGKPYDFEPQRVGLRSEGGVALFSSLSWRADGTDGRLARLSGSVLIPGRPPLMEEKFSSTAQEVVGGLMGGLMGRLTGKKEESAKANSWPQNWRKDASAFTRDTTAKRLRLEGLQDGDLSTIAEPSSTYPLRNATVAITARVNLRASPAPTAAAGMYLEDRWRSGKPDDETGNRIYVNLNKGKLRLEQFNANSKTWSLLHGYPWPHKDKEVELRLVTQGNQVWVFVDRHLVISQSVEDMYLHGISGGGLRIEGLGALEASSFRIDEL